MDAEHKVQITEIARFPLAGLAEIPPEDRSSALLLFIYEFGSAGGYVTARTVADSLFLSQIGPGKLPAMYMVSAGAVALASIIYGSLTRQHSLRQIVRWTLVAYAVISLCLPLLMRQGQGSLALFASVYVFAQIRGAIGTVQFTTLLNETFVQRRHASVFGIVAMGATLAGIVMGCLVGWLGQRVATADLMYLAAGMDLVAFLPILFVRGSRSVAAANPSLAFDCDDGSPTPAGRPIVLRSPPLLWLAGLACLTVIVSTLVEFQWKVAAAEEFVRDEARLTTYFGYFYATVFVLIGVSQLLFTGPVLRRVGAIPALIILPMALTASSLYTLAASAQRVLLWPITLAKGCDVLRRSFNDPGMQMLYAPLAKHDRRRAIAIVFGIVKPSAEAVAAVGLLALVPLVDLRDFSYVTFILALVWLGMVAWYSRTGFWSRKKS